MVLEELSLLWGRVTAQHLIAMGKTPETFDDIVMLSGEIRSELVAKFFVEINTTLLIVQIFTMHEGQIEKLPLLR